MKYGLKIWSTNTELFNEAVSLSKKGDFDFIEIYIVPNSIADKKLNISGFKGVLTAIHTTHMEHGFNIFELDDLKLDFFQEQVVKTANFLGSKFIILHPDAGESREIFKKNVKKIKDERILIENMPKIGLNNELCFGYSFEQLKFINGLGFDICLDFGHAIKSAMSQKINYKKFIERIILELNPFYFHITNGRADNEKDEHMDLFGGDFDIKWIKKTLQKLKGKRQKEAYLVFETPKGKRGLKNDIKNINYFRSL